ncbi:MAG TPA: protease, partial [Candidatus Dormibacteraeota bacterium]|nr:protease [Candidatus Dormibacteraeota bacterium]
MYHQIARNKRNSVIVIIGFLAVWVIAGLIIGELAYGSSGAITGAVILALLGVAAAMFSYYFGSATVLSAVGAQEAD